MKTRDVLLAISGAAVAAAAGVFLARRYRKTIPDGVEAVKDFDVDKYLGRWYEIARLDYVSEKNLSRVTADYSLNDDGSLMVINCGYDKKRKRWASATGKAKFADANHDGKLKVSFFGPIYDGYNVVAIDEHYKYALVFGRNLNYMWLLSRNEIMPDKVKEEYLEIAKNAGYDVTQLIWTEQKVKPVSLELEEYDALLIK